MSKPTPAGLASLLAMATIAHAVNPVLHWPLDEPVGSTHATETISGETQVAEVLGVYYWGDGVAPGRTRSLNLPNAPTNYVEAGTLQTNGNYVPTPTATDNDTLGNAFSMVVWVNAERISSNTRAYISGGGSSGDPWIFGEQFGTPYFKIRNTDSFATVHMEEYKDFMVAVVADPSGAALGGANFRFFTWDGSLWQTLDAGYFGDPGLGNLRIGNEASGFDYDGSINDVRLYDQALTQANLNSLALFNAIGGDLGAIIQPVVTHSNSSNLQFKVDFTEDVGNFDPSDLSFVTTGATTVQAGVVVSGIGSSYTVSVPVVGEGSVAVEFDPGNDVQAAVGGGPLMSAPVSPATHYDTTGPVMSVEFQPGNPTGSSYIRCLVTWDESVQDFSFNSVDGVSSGITIGSQDSFLNADQSELQINLYEVTGTGTYSLDLAGDHTVTDLAGNPAQNPAPAVVTRILDSTAPTIVSITPSTTTPTDGRVEFTVTYSEPINGFPFAFTENKSGVNTISYFNFQGGSFVTSYQVTADALIPDGASSGSYSLTIDSSSGITDLAGNPLTNSLTSPTVTVGASPYQNWAISAGLTPGPDFGPGQNPDGDPWNNVSEFILRSNPNQADQPTLRTHVVQPGDGMSYGAVTLIARDETEVLSSSVSGSRVILRSHAQGYQVDQFLLGNYTLPVQGTGDSFLLDDPSVGAPAGLPVLPTGWSYRTFRFSEPTTTFPKGFSELQVFSNPFGSP